MNYIQLKACILINSNYKIIFSLLIYFIIYFCFYGDKTFVFCMNDNIMPTIAEAKPIRTVVRSVIQREVFAFAGYAEILEEQKKIIQELTEEKIKLQNQNKTLTEVLKTTLLEEEKSLERISQNLNKMNFETKK